MANLVSRTLLAVALVCTASPALAGGLADKPLPPTLFTRGTPDGNELSWIPPPANPGGPIEGYKVYRLNNTRQELLWTASANQTTYFDAQVSPDYVYTYFVTSQSSGGESVPSNLGTAYPHCQFVDPLSAEVDLTCLFPVPGGPGSMIIRP